MKVPSLSKKNNHVNAADNLSKNKYYIGVDLGGTRIKIGLVSDHRVIEKKMLSADPRGGLQNSLCAITAEINSLMQKPGTGELSGIGLGFPGLVDPVDKRILSTNKKYDDALEVDLQKWANDNWAVPFCVDNDARMAALGEWKSGAATDTDNFVSVTIGTGVGTAVVMEGKLLRGKHFQAGCLGGHFSLSYHGHACTCGNIGCLEAYASTWSIKERIVEDPGYSTSLLSGVASIDFENLFSAAKRGDALAIKIRQDCLDAWSTGIISLIHAYDPDVVILGGGAMNNHEDILPYVTQRVHEHAWTPWGKVALRPTMLLSNAGILGATYCVQYNL